MRFVFEASSRCVGVCFASYMYIYILSYGDIYIFIFVFGMGGWVRVFRIACFFIIWMSTVLGFGKIKILFLVGASGVHIGCCLNPLEVSFLLISLRSGGLIVCR